MRSEAIAIPGQASFVEQIPVWEVTAVALALAYLLLAVRQNRWCWAAAFLSTAIFTVLFWDAQLQMQSALNVYYMGMAIYGWWHWQHGGSTGAALRVRRWPLRLHAVAITMILAVSLGSGLLLSRHTEAALPYLDSLVTWAAVVTTFMVARKVLENWAYWMVINSLAIVLFVDRGMLPTAGLHAAYLIISVFGWRGWLQSERGLKATPTPKTS